MNRNTNEKDKKLKNSFKGKNERLYFDIGANIGMWSLKNIKNNDLKKNHAWVDSVYFLWIDINYNMHIFA